jgi:hypothetical protein
MTFTDEQIQATLAEVVAESPEKVYLAPDHMAISDYEDSPLAGLSCFYVHTDEAGNNPECGCLVGAVLYRLGVPLETLAENEGKGAWEVGGNLGLPSASRRLLANVQDAQDNGIPWAEALRTAEQDGAAL